MFVFLLAPFLWKCPQQFHPLQILLLNLETNSTCGTTNWRASTLLWANINKDCYTKWLKIPLSRPKPLIIAWCPSENIITLRRILFWIKHNQLESQHSFTSEDQEGLLWKLLRNPGFSPENPSFWSMTPVKNTISRCRIKFCI